MTIQLANGEAIVLRILNILWYYICIWMCFLFLLFIIYGYDYEYL